jgi:glycosyltransferase involved in cell wall biosynthesis
LGPSQKSRGELLQRLGIRPDSKVCITTGRAHPYKRYDFIIDTAAELQKLAPDNDLIFLLIGDGPAYYSLVEQVEHLGLTEKVILPGFRADARDLLSAADIAMHAALGEGFSLSIVEYMSAGLPALVPDIPSVKQAVDHNENGFVYSKDDPVNAAHFINSLIRNPKTARAMGSRAQSKANTRYSLVNCTREFQAKCNALFDTN